VTTLRLGTRGSPLALFQARLVAQRIAASGGPPSDIVVIKTSGDQLANAPLSESGGKRLFVKEIEDALAGGDVDIAVHSSKDMPAELPEGLAIGAVLPREDPADALVLPGQDRGRGSSSALAGNTTADFDIAAIRERIGRTARIGTGSVRRSAQLRRLFPRASFQNVRGNLDTRLRKLDAGDYDLLVLAAAGLLRLGFDSRISMKVSLDDCIPAPGQGIIAIEIRDGDSGVQAAVAAVNDAETAAALDAERALVVALGGGCQMPIGGVATPAGASALELSAIVASLDGTRAIRYKKVGTKAEAKALGRDVAEYLLNAGASKILDESRNPNPEPRQLT
jgi:hydroxymethylbilane synthase